MERWYFIPTKRWQHLTKCAWWGLSGSHTCKLLRNIYFFIYIFSLYTFTYKWIFPQEMLLVWKMYVWWECKLCSNVSPQDICLSGDSPWRYLVRHCLILLRKMSPKLTVKYVFFITGVLKLFFQLYTNLWNVCSATDPLKRAKPFLVEKNGLLPDSLNKNLDPQKWTTNFLMLRVL